MKCLWREKSPLKLSSEIFGNRLNSIVGFSLLAVDCEVWVIICLSVRAIENVKAYTLMGKFSYAVIIPVELISLFSIKAGQVSAL